MHLLLFGVLLCLPFSFLLCFGLWNICVFCCACLLLSSHSSTLVNPMQTSLGIASDFQVPRHGKRKTMDPTDSNSSNETVTLQPAAVSDLHSASLNVDEEMEGKHEDDADTRCPQCGKGGATLSCSKCYRWWHVNCVTNPPSLAKNKTWKCPLESGCSKCNQPWKKRKCYDCGTCNAALHLECCVKQKGNGKLMCCKCGSPM